MNQTPLFSNIMCRWFWFGRERGIKMFEIGTCIICGQHGVCRVAAIGPLKLYESSKEREYYTLNPIYSKGGVIYVPADSDKIVMREIISQKDAEKLIEEIRDMEGIFIENEKRRDDVFKKALRTCDYKEWVRIIKTLYARKQRRLAQGKKVTASDERYLKAAEDSLYGELAIALEMTRRDVEKSIVERIIEKEKVV